LGLAVLAVGLMVGAPWARAQLPPDPSDTPPMDGSAVRPTPAPRTLPPPPPDRRRTRAGTNDGSGPAIPPPPPPPEGAPPLEGAPPPAAAGPALPAPFLTVDKIFATRGVVELGGSLDFSVQRDFINDATWLNLGLDAYVGYFVVKYFTLGMYLSVRYSQYISSEFTSWSVAPGVLVAPGIAVRLRSRVFFYGDFLIGLFGRKSEHSKYNRDTDLYGALGAEAGVKVRMTRRLLLRLGIRLTYDVGKRDSDLGTGTIESDISQFTFLFRVGLSGFL